MRLFWFIYIILVTPLKEFIQIYYVKNPVLNSANYNRCMPTRPPVDPRTVYLNKLRHTVLIWRMLNYKMARLYMVNHFTYRIMHPLNRFFSKQNTLSSFIWLYDFFFSLEFVIKVILKHTIKIWHIHLRLLDQTKSCCTFLNQNKNWLYELLRIN